MAYAVEMTSGGMTYTTSFINIGSSVKTFLGGKAWRHTHKAISQAYFYFLKTRELG
jgi:hypothetical protein